MNSEATKERFVDLCVRLPDRMETNPHHRRAHGEGVFGNITSRYSEPHRAYHILNHIDQMLKEFNDGMHLAKDPEAVEFAIWFHDFIYETKSQTNESDSAGCAARILTILCCPSGFTNKVKQLILATKHDVAPTDNDAMLLVDLDFSILGQPESVFDEYEKQIRKEYEWVPAEVFAAKREKILRSFLNRPSIYNLPHFREKYEKQARENLQRSLNHLENKNRN